MPSTALRQAATRFGLTLGATMPWKAASSPSQRETASAIARLRGRRKASGVVAGSRGGSSPMDATRRRRVARPASTSVSARASSRQRTTERSPLTFLPAITSSASGWTMGM